MPASVALGKRLADVRSLARLLDVLFVPGIVAHELGHAAVCRLLGIEIREITPFEWPQTALTSGGRGGGRVAHEPIESAWKALLVSLGPLVANTVLALVVFALLSNTVLVVDFLAYPSSVTSLARVYAGHLADATRFERLLAVGGLWVGCATAVTAMPSPGDALTAMDAALDAAGLERRLTYPPAVVLFLLSSSALGFGLLYGVVITAVGLHGVDLAVALYPTYLAYAAVGLFLGPFERGTGFVSVSLARLRRPNRPFVELTPVVYRRVHLLGRRARGDEPLDDEAIASLVRHLGDQYDHVRRTCAHALHVVATADPERLARWDGTVVERWREEPDSLARYHLLAVLARRAEHTDDPRAFRDVALEAFADASSDVRSVGVQLAAHLSLNDPGVFRDDADVLVEALTDDEVADGDRSNLSLPILKLAERDPAVLEPYRDDLEPYAASSNETVARRIAAAVEAVDEATDDPRARPR
ncbi:hypothetical protein [Salinilacihabitans rarus]|uniref:hypothetical protein n=1 Tax=Salinilacihabitans rarus TaxID=2961596 RepID=UPI0020C912CC|nr:hypothetical protein [Salinilacihabitans rarus]